MTMGKQLTLCAILLSAYNSLSMCMDTQELDKQTNIEQASIEQKLNFDAFPLNVQEQIISYLPANNLYRALWSRCHNASQQFHDDTAKAYLESNFVPQELIDKTVTQDFAQFKGSKKQKREFQEKIKRALQRYCQEDTDLVKACRQCIKQNEFLSVWIENFRGDIFLAQSLINQLDYPDIMYGMSDYSNLIGRLNEPNRQKIEEILLRFKQNFGLSRLKKVLQKYCSYLVCCETIFSNEGDRTTLRDILYVLHSKLKRQFFTTEVPIELYLTCFGIMGLLVSLPLNLLDAFIVDLPDGLYLSLRNGGLVLIGLIIPTFITRQILSYADSKLSSYNYGGVIRIAYQFAKRQAIIKQTLDIIDQLEKAEYIT